MKTGEKREWNRNKQRKSSKGIRGGRGIQGEGKGEYRERGKGKGERGKGKGRRRGKERGKGIEGVREGKKGDLEGRGVI